MRIKKLLLLIVLAALLTAALIIYFNGAGKTGTATLASPAVINEAMSSNKGSVPDGLGNYPDWIELKNNTASELDIGGYGLTDDFSAGVKYVFPTGTKIPANGYIVVFCAGESLSPLHAPFKISASDTVILYDVTGNTLDTLTLHSVSTGMSLGKPNDDGQFAEMKPSPGYPNTDAGIAAFEESLKSEDDIGVYINEFMASNATTITDMFGFCSDWMELYNTNDYEVDLSGFGISDSISQPMKYMLPEGTKIGAGEYLVIFCSGNESAQSAGEIHVPFSLSAYEEDVVLATNTGAILDSFSYSRQESDVSMARVPDGTGEFQTCSRPTPGFPNTDAGYDEFMKSANTTLGSVYISEMMGSNTSALSASDGSFPDWIELYNSSDAPVSLSGCALSNNAKNPAKWVFPDVSIDAGEYLVIYASGLNKKTEKSDLHTNFAISSSGDSVFLFDPEGRLLDKVAAGAFMADVSMGRDADGSFLYYSPSTPGAQNGTGYLGTTAIPAFSQTPGVFNAPITLTLDVPEGETVYYTLDCTTPTTSSTKYDGAITVAENTVVRAFSVRDGYITNGVATGTFLFTTDGVNHALPIATLVTDPDNLWNSQTGIYAMGDQYDPDVDYGKMLETATFYKAKFASEDAKDEWERPGVFSIFDDAGSQVFTQNIGMRIAGSFGRGRAQKGFNVIARDEYGADRMEYAFFDNRPYTEYKALVLRAGGQDQNRSKIRDELCTGLLEGSGVNFLYQAYKPYVLYLNGEYWGVYFMKEKRNRFFVAQHEGITNVKDMDICYASTRVSYGSNKEWLELMSFINSNDLSNASNYAHVCDEMDVTSFMDYIICELYVGNSDYANIQYYKLPGGKWKWVYYDFCWGFGDVNHKTISLRRGTKPAASGLFNALLKNAEWRDKFVRRFAELMKTVYNQERVNALVDELYAVVEPEIERERALFNQDTFMGQRQHSTNLGSYSGFLTNIEGIRSFAQKRPAVIKAQLQSELGLSDAYMAEVFGE